MVELLNWPHPDSQTSGICKTNFEFVLQFDFLEERNITGFVTKGGDDGWVTAFTVKYSHDKQTWNPIMDVLQDERIFLGNFDSNSPQTNSFELPICARYIKIIPNRWHNKIQLRIEIQGCFKPYRKKH